jgi:hypothetical protein
LAKRVPAAEKELTRLHQQALARFAETALPSLSDGSPEREINPVSCELWINKTMRKTQLSPSSKVDSQPLRNFGLDRATMEKSGLPIKLIQRLHRMLYVYSAGFHQVLTEVTVHIKTHLNTMSLARGNSSCEQPDAGEFVKRVWLTFLRLLESCDPKHYGTVLSSIMGEHAQALARTEDTLKKSKQEDFVRTEELSAENVRLALVLKTSGERLQEQGAAVESMRASLDEGRQRQQRWQEQSDAAAEVHLQCERNLKRALDDLEELNVATAREKAVAAEQEARRFATAEKVSGLQVQ